MTANAADDFAAIARRLAELRAEDARWRAEAMRERAMRTARETIEREAASVDRTGQPIPYP